MVNCVPLSALKMLASPPFTLGFAAALIWRVSCSCTDYRPPPIHRLRCSLWVEGTGTHAPLLGAREHEAAFCVSVVDTLAEPEFFQRSRDVTLEMLLGGVAKALQPWGWEGGKGLENWRPAGPEGMKRLGSPRC